MTFYYWSGNKSIPGDFWSYFIYGQNFYWVINGDIGTRVPGSFHFWYLTLDFYLVLIWTFVVKVTKREHLKRVFWGLMFFSVVYRSAIPLVSDNILLTYTMPWGTMDAFSVGGLLALRVKEGKPLLRLGNISLMAALMLMLVCVVSMKMIKGVGVIKAITMYSSAYNYGDNPVTILILTVMSLFACAAISYCFSIKKELFISNYFVAKIGGMSYELYVLHFPILYLLGLWLNNKYVIGLIAYILTFVLSKAWKLIF